MTFEEYQEQTSKTAIYPKEIGFMYLTLGLTGEAGEVADKVKKVLRDHGGWVDEKTKLDLMKEMGDVYWYLSELATYLDVSMSEVAHMNLDKLASRKERNKIGGSGDER